MKTCESIKKKTHHNNYKERGDIKSYILSQTKSCEKEKKKWTTKGSTLEPRLGYKIEEK